MIYNVNVYLTEVQSQQLEQITETLNQQQEGKPKDPAAVLEMILNTGLAPDIDQRFRTWQQILLD